MSEPKNNKTLPRQNKTTKPEPAKGATTAAPAVAPPKPGEAKKKTEPTVEVIVPLKPEEVADLTKHEETIETMKVDIVAAFFAIAAAFYEIREKKLYRGSHGSFAEYFQDKWNYGRAHANRLAKAGEIIKTVSPQGDTYKLLTSESHYRPLVSLKPEDQASVLGLVGEWAKMSKQTEVSPHMVESAVAFINPAKGPAERDEDKDGLVTRCVEVVTGIEKRLPQDTSGEVKKLFGQLKAKVKALGNPARTTGIDWTNATWNPLQGCAHKSEGCDKCYAAELVATRLAGVYPGLASVKVDKNGKKSYFFNNIILLLPEHLGIPLKDGVPKMYFVNSMSDLFHDKVPVEFISAVFDVMEKASWHQFQVLTKRPKRMAAFTTERYKDKTPPANVWLGTSTENQAAYDERYPELLKVKAAVRWLSIEPLIGAIKISSLEGVDWVVVGGESGSTRKMEKKWATDICDACEKAKVPFFFKQWGEYGEDGLKLKKAKKDGLTPPPLDGKIHNAYPKAPAAKPVVDTPVEAA